MAITESSRNAYIAGHVRTEVRLALRTFVRESGKYPSASAFISAAIEEKLEREGVEVPKEVTANKGEPLPFDAPEFRVT